MAAVRSLVRALVRHDPRRFIAVTVLQVASSLTQGIGLLFLVPLLALAGVAGTSPPEGGLLARLADRVGLAPGLRGALVLYVGVVAIQAGLNAWQGVVTARYRMAFVDGLRIRLFRSIAQARWQDVSGVRQSDLLTALVQNVGTVNQGATGAMRLTTSLWVAIVQIVVAVRIAPGVTGIAAATAVVLGAVVWPLLRRSRRLGNELVAHNRRLMGSVTDFLGGLRIAKAHGSTDAHVGFFERDITATRRAQVAFQAASATSSAIQLALTAAILAVVVDIAIGRLGLPLSRLLVVAYVFSRLVPQLVTIPQQLHMVVQSGPALDELTDLIASCESAPEPAVSPDAPRLRLDDAVRLDHVSFAYGDGEPVLHDVTLSLAANRTTALVGPSGAGKTTIADLVLGLLTPTSGGVLVDGVRLEVEQLARWRASIAVSPQDPFLFHDTIRWNLRWAAPEATDDELWAALDSAAARDLVASMPEGLDTVVGDRGTRLSGGERQRIALARALVRRPTLLVLDEATSALDTENERSIRQSLVRLHGEATVLVIAHRLSTVARADHVIVLDSGRVVEEGTWDELLARTSGRLRNLVEAGELP